MRASPSVIIWKQTSGHCVYCGEQIEPSRRTADHVLPKSEGGIRTLQNLVPACQECNGRRGTLWPPSTFAHPRWLEYVRNKEQAVSRVKVSKMLEKATFVQATQIARRRKAAKVMAIFEGGHLVARQHGICVVMHGRDICTVSWQDVGAAFQFQLTDQGGS